MDNQGTLSGQSTDRLSSTSSPSAKHHSTIEMSHTTSPVLPEHVYFRVMRLVAGLSCCPTTRGQSVVILQQPAEYLFSLDQGTFLEVMSSVKHLAHTLRDFYGVKRCALITEGTTSLSIAPLHGLQKSWQPVTAPGKEFHEIFPGYISSKDGPTMEPAKLAQITATIRQETGLEQPLNHHFKGHHADNNLFARLIRGEIPQSRIWEDANHVAFLTPFANTPGFTVLVPRQHLPSDIFSIDDTNYANLMNAAHTVAGHLMKSLGISRCGMIFEGFEVDYAHVKLIPIHSRGEDIALCQETVSTTQIAPYEERYRGYVTSLSGPVSRDQESLAGDASALRGIVGKSM